MRIIAGEFRGRKLDAPKGDGTRPTTDRVRESLERAFRFPARRSLDGAVVLDAFAGSGALSWRLFPAAPIRPCSATRDRDAAAVIERNIAALRLGAIGRASCAATFSSAVRRRPGVPSTSSSSILPTPPIRRRSSASSAALATQAPWLPTSSSATQSTTPPTTMPWRRWPETSGYEIASRRHFGDTTPRSFGAFVHGMRGVFHSFSIMVEW